MKRYELTPNGTQKSFYGKAVVMVDSDGTETLYSYNTPIIKRLASGELVKLWGGWSNTTGKSGGIQRYTLQIIEWRERK